MSEQEKSLDEQETTAEVVDDAASSTADLDEATPNGDAAVEVEQGEGVSDDALVESVDAVSDEDAQPVMLAEAEPEEPEEPASVQVDGAPGRVEVCRGVQAPREPLDALGGRCRVGVRKTEHGPDPHGVGEERV